MNKKTRVDKNFVTNSLVKKIEEVNWKNIQNEMERFVQVEEIPSLKIWDKTFFSQIIRKKLN